MTAPRPSTQPAAWLGQPLRVIVDRPLGARHPRWPDMIYPVNYGYVPDTRAADGAEIDAYVLGAAGPLEMFEGVCIAILHRADDVEDKLVVAPRGLDFTDQLILDQTRFQERYFETRLIR